MGQIPHRLKNAWGVRLRLKVPKDAGLVIRLMGYSENLLCFNVELFLGRERKENAMNGSEFFILYFAARVVVPFGMLLLIGELLRRKESNYWLK